MHAEYSHTYPKHDYVTVTGMMIQHNQEIAQLHHSLVPMRPHPQEGERLVYNVEILGCAESTCSENG